MPVRSLAVFCGSKNGKNPMFTQHAIHLGKLMAEYNVKLIYGGGSAGIMGSIADSILAHGGKATGIIPKILVDWERQHLGLTELIVCDDMHIRKKTIYSMCDGALILPGGYGTLDELFEIITWNQLSIHDKQLFLLNTDGFYDHLISHINKMREEEFLYEKVIHSLKVVTDPSALISYFKD